MKDYFGADTFQKLIDFGLSKEEAMTVHNYMLGVLHNEIKYDEDFVAHCLTLQMLREGKKFKKLEVGQV